MLVKGFMAWETYSQSSSLRRLCYEALYAGKCCKNGGSNHTQGEEQVGLVWVSIRPPDVIYSHLPSRPSCPALSARACTHTHTHAHTHTHTHTP